MNTQKKSLIFIISLIFIGVGSYLLFINYFKIPIIAPVKIPVTTPMVFNPLNTTITYLTSLSDSTEYCNGSDMDSAGYQKTITNEITTSTPELNTTILQLIKTTIDVATTGMCHDALSQSTITENDGVVSISSIEGWAGVSITMCSCKPQVEVNLLRLPGITKVLW